MWLFRWLINLWPKPDARTLRQKLIDGDVPGLGSYRDPRPGDIRSPEIDRIKAELRAEDLKRALEG
jgi:hypothetical protein